MSMRKLITGSLAATCLFAATAASVFAAPEVGKPAPSFSAIAADGSSVSLDALRGQKVVLEWTNHECPFVVKHYRTGNMQATQAAAVEHGAVWLQVISSAPGTQGHVEAAKAVELNHQRNVTAVAHTLLDPEGKVGQAYDARVTPHMYIIDEEGTLVYMGGIDSIASTRDGDIDKASNYVKEALTALAAGEAVPNPVTRAYGCTIKYDAS
ncbi:MAG: redoxin domain-containing protein [Rhodocyclaceae bacterium]